MSDWETWLHEVLFVVLDGLTEAGMALSEEDGKIMVRHNGNELAILLNPPSEIVLHIPPSLTLSPLSAQEYGH